MSKQLLKVMRDEGWEKLLDEVCLFCNKHKIDIIDMNALFHGRSSRKSQGITNFHHYYVEIFCTVLDWQLQELNDRFTEASTDLFLSVACLNPSDCFAHFDKDKLIHLASIYSNDFSPMDLMKLDSQLDNCISDMRTNQEFLEVQGISCLARKLVGTKKHIVFLLVYRLLKLALILPVATATVEIAFSAMKIIKSRLRNSMADQLMNDCLITYIEKDVFDCIDNESIMQRFQRMKTRRGQL